MLERCLLTIGCRNVDAGHECECSQRRSAQVGGHQVSAQGVGDRINDPLITDVRVARLCTELMNPEVARAVALQVDDEQRGR